MGGGGGGGGGGCGSNKHCLLTFLVFPGAQSLVIAGLHPPSLIKVLYETISTNHTQYCKKSLTVATDTLYT